MQDLPFEQLLERLQIAIANVGNGPVIEVGVNPMEQMVTLASYDLLRFARPGRLWPDKQINEMLAPLVNQSRYRAVIEIIKPTTNQWKPVTGQIDDRRCKIELGIQPRFDSVLIGGSYVSEMVCHKRTHVTSDKLRRQELIGTRLL